MLQTRFTAMFGVQHPIVQGGMIQGLIHNIPTCAVLVARIVAEAEAIIATRLARMLAA